MAITRTMSPWLGLDKLSIRLTRKFLFLWAKTTVLPGAPMSLGINPGKPVVYILETKSLANLLVLDQECATLRLPRPTARSAIEGLPRGRSVVAIKSRDQRTRGRSRAFGCLNHLVSVVQVVVNSADLDAQLVPVSIFWGRSPDKERQWFRILFSDTWAVVGRLRKLFIVLMHGRNILVQFSPPISVRQFVDEKLDEQRNARKLLRVLAVHFRHLRTATIGPDLSHRRTLVDDLLRTKAVRRAIAAEIEEKNVTELKATYTARQYANEIAADYSYSVILLLERVLSRLWNKLYDGIEVHNIETLQRVAPGNVIVYVPCHRSHIDYLLLSYVLYEAGLVPPHVAAGVNLNIPLIGPVLRRAGAFFLRRTFKGNRLYAAVFRQYLSTNLARGVSIEYFVEGGRSRTGRSLQPKMGMLDMTLRSFCQHPVRPLVFVPVYIGYERLLEGRTYIAELGGAAKEKESLGGLLRAFGRLRGKFGKVHVNFGEPLFMEAFLSEKCPDWRQTTRDPDDRPDWLQPVVHDLGRQVMIHINNAADLNPINLLALVLLATPKHAMDEVALAQQIDLYIDLLTKAPYSDWSTITTQRGREIIRYGEVIGVIRRRKHELGDILYLEGRNAVLMTYFRNNILHLFTLPAIIACCFENAQSVSCERIVQLGGLAYPYIRSELFLPWEEKDLPEVVRRLVDVMVELQLLQNGLPDRVLQRPAVGSGEEVQLTLLAHSVIHTFERFYIAVALLLREGPGKISQTDLEHRCHMMAQRISLLYESNAPEFLDKSLFRNFIGTLGEMGMLWPDENGLLTYDQSFRSSYEDAKELLSEQVRHSLLQVTRGELAG